MKIVKYEDSDGNKIGETWGWGIKNFLAQTSSFLGRTEIVEGFWISNDNLANSKSCLTIQWQECEIHGKFILARIKR